MASHLRRTTHKLRTRLFNLKHRGQAPGDRPSCSKRNKTPAVAPAPPPVDKMSAAPPSPVAPSVDPSEGSTSGDEQPRGRSPARRIDFTHIERRRVKENQEHETVDKSIEILRQHGVEAKQWN
ncbi:hypothetical protein OQA88_4549 [Cercophora sp. LCS_1]